MVLMVDRVRWGVNSIVLKKPTQDSGIKCSPFTFELKRCSSSNLVFSTPPPPRGKGLSLVVGVGRGWGVNSLAFKKPIFQFLTSYEA